MDCIMKDVVALDRSGLCPFNGQKCDGTMSITWGTDYVVIPESKVCISQLHIDGQPALVEVTAADLHVACGDYRVIGMKFSVRALEFL